MTYNDLRKRVESLVVPSWSTSLRIPWTFAFILKTWREREDWRLLNAASSGEFGTAEREMEEGRESPDSISWKLIGRVGGMLRGGI